MPPLLHGERLAPAPIDPLPARFEDWPARLAAWVEGGKHREFRWGKWDCLIAAALWVEAATGAGILGDIPAYSSQHEAERLLTGHGGLFGVVNRHGRRCSPAIAGRGDLALYRAPDGPSLGVIVGMNALRPGPVGWIVERVPDALATWKV